MNSTNNFGPAHTYLSHALLSLSNPVCEAFVCVRNSSVSCTAETRKSVTEDPNGRITQSHEILQTMKQNIKDLIGCSTSISRCRFHVESLMNSTTNTVIEQHADLFNDGGSSDNNSGDEWDEFGSDVEEINE